MTPSRPITPRVASTIWLTTADVARMLAITVHGVRWLARSGRLSFDLTVSGQRLFRQSEVLGLVQTRAKAHLAGQPTVGIVGEPRQLSLFGKARLQLVPGRESGERSLRDPVANERVLVKESRRVR